MLCRVFALTPLQASLIGQAPPKLKGKVSQPPFLVIQSGFSCPRKMARMVATKAALSIRVDALSDADDKSEAQAASIGVENRAKLEARLHSLEQQGDATTVRSAFAAKKQTRFQMTGETKTYNTAADAVDLMPTQREPMEAAVKAVQDVKAEKKKAKEERKAKKRAEKEQIEDGIEEARMDLDGEEESKESKKEKKRKRRESEAMDVDPEEKVCCSMSSGSVCGGPDRLSCAATGGDGGGAQSAKEGKEGREGGGGCSRGRRRIEEEEEEKVRSIAANLSAASWTTLSHCHLFCVVFLLHIVSAFCLAFRFALNTAGPFSGSLGRNAVW